MRVVAIIIFLFLGSSVNAQRIKSESLISKADSILFSYVGESLSKYFSFNYNQGSYYTYTNKFGKSRTASMKPNKKTRGVFVNANIRYSFCYPKIKGVNGSTFVKFNRKNERVGELELEYIPEFLKVGQSCNFISPIEAAEISLDSLNHRGLDINGPILDYSFKHNRYVYTIDDYISRNCCNAGLEYGLREVIIIDAISGQIINHEYQNFGWIIIR